MASAERLGAVAGTVQALEAAAVRAMGDPAWRRETGARARRHVATHHAPDVVLERVAEVFEGVAQARRRKK
jgi:hypothetical protein